MKVGVPKKRAAALVKKLRWTKPWFLVAGINGTGTRELTFAVMDFLEAQRRGAVGAQAGPQPRRDQLVVVVARDDGDPPVPHRLRLS